MTYSRQENKQYQKGKHRRFDPKNMNTPPPNYTPTTASIPITRPAARYTVPEDVEQLWQTYKSDQSNVSLRNQLVEIYLPLVIYNAERLHARVPQEIELGDLIGSGVFGLMDAVKAFDLSRGVKFETYCVPRIRGAMLDELRVMDWVPRLVRSKAIKIKKATGNLETRLGREPKDEEIAKEIGISLSQLETMKLEINPHSFISLNKKWYETDSYKEVREIDIIYDRNAPSPSDKMEKGDLWRVALKGLNRNERLIMILYYGEELTMKEIGETLDLSESRISQMHSTIIERMQEKIRQGDELTLYDPRSKRPRRAKRKAKTKSAA